MASLHHILCTYYIEIVKVCKAIKTGLHIFYVHILLVSIAVCFQQQQQQSLYVDDETDCCWGQLSFIILFCSRNGNKKQVVAMSLQFVGNYILQSYSEHNMYQQAGL